LGGYPQAKKRAKKEKLQLPFHAIYSMPKAIQEILAKCQRQSEKERPTFEDILNPLDQAL